jgi:hypothetical protein
MTIENGFVLAVVICGIWFLAEAAFDDLFKGD